MISQQVELQALVARLELVEKQNRTLKRAFVVFLLLPLTLLLMGQAKQRRVVTAEEFVLTDSSGRIRAALRLIKPSGEPRLHFFGRDGIEQMFLEADGIIMLGSPRGTAAESLGTWGSEANLSLRHKENLITVTAGSAGPNFSLKDSDGFSAAIGSTETEVIRTGEKRKTSAASLVMFGKDGKVVWSAP